MKRILKGRTPKNINLLIEKAKKFQKGDTPWNKGLTKEDERVEKYSAKIRKENNPRWKGGSSTYFHIEARKLLGIKERKIVVHHKDGDYKNNSIENLQIMELKEHSSLHHKGKHTSPNTEFKKGMVPWNKHHSCINNLSIELNGGKTQ